MKKLKLRVFSRDISAIASPMMSKLDSVIDVLFGIFKKNRLRRNLKWTTSLISMESSEIAVEHPDAYNTTCNLQTYFQSEALMSVVSPMGRCYSHMPLKFLKV